MNFPLSEMLAEKEAAKIINNIGVLDDKLTLFSFSIRVA